MKIKSNNLSQVVQAMQLHKPGDKFIVKDTNVVRTVTIVYISESGKVLYDTIFGNYSPEQCDWITTIVTK